jgi:hypothetical protein
LSNRVPAPRDGHRGGRANLPSALGLPSSNPQIRGSAGGMGRRRTGGVEILPVKKGGPGGQNREEKAREAEGISPRV